MKAWTTALKAMENLVDGMPQLFQDVAHVSRHSLSGETAVDAK
jgi:hypothetical protein